MGLFDFLKTSSNKQFVTENSLKRNSENQLAMTPKTLMQLREIDVDENMELKLEYFFYTNNLEKAQKLAAELEALHYSVDFGKSGSDKNLFVITGWSTRMQMSNEAVGLWTSQMCQLGYKYDCEFDGWGTSPDQD